VLCARILKGNLGRGGGGGTWSGEVTGGNEVVETEKGD
jgi:hypothetical protein